MADIEGIGGLADLLRSSPNPAEVERQLLPEPWRRTLQVCSPVTVITPALFDSVLRQYVPRDAPPLEDLANRGLIQPVDGEPPGWRVPPAEAARWMREWGLGLSDDRPARPLIELESDLADWYEAHDDDNEQLRHLLVADQQRALSLFRTMFGDADDERDFALCQDLLDVLADPSRITLAGPEMSELRLDRSGYLRARLYWSIDYSRSAQFLAPPGLRERTERLLSGAGSHIWQLYAPGGTGKTTQLRWLIARRCVTADADIACARIDFDVVDPVNVARYPWLLLLDIAAQFDLRWPRRVFERLDRFASYRSLAQRRTSELTREAASGLADLDLEEVERQVTEIFVRRFNQAARGRPSVLIVDTLEEVTVGGVGQADSLLRLLGLLVRECPRLRLVLAGRYDLRELAPQAMLELPPAESFELTNFGPDQVDAYLRDIRGITDPTLHRAVYERTQGQPFEVAIFADDICEQPGISAEQIATLGEPATRLLIDRFINRIVDPDVRWLVRYGVIPRRLRFDDIAAVMLPFLVRGRSGPSDSDDPRKDEHHLVGSDAVFPFGAPLHDDAAIDETWRRLLRYAAKVSWVSPVEDGGSVVFHPNVREPMRDLVSQQPVFGELHEAFRRRFEYLAEQDQANRAAYLREAVYHRIQMDNRDAIDFWRAQVIRCRDDGDLSDMEALAGELLRDDYVEDGRPRKRGDGRPLFADEVLIEANVFIAYAAAERARAIRASRSDPLWSTVRRSLGNADLVRARLAEPPAVSALEIALQAALLVADAKPAEALAVANAAERASDDSRVDVLRVKADALAAMGDPEAGPAYREALDLAVRTGRADQQNAITLSLASQSERQGRLDQAIAWAARLAKSTADILAGAARTWRTVRGRLLIDCYQPAAALRALGEVRDEKSPSVSAEIARLRARAYFLLGRADHALGELDAAVAATAEMPAASRYAHLAQTHQLRGVILGELLALDDAEDSFKLAFSLWGEIGFSDGHPECTYLYRRFLIQHVGDLAAASQVARPPMGMRDELALLWEEQTADLLARQGSPARARTAEPIAPELPPRQAARIMAARLARSWPENRDMLPALLERLGQIRPPSARLFVLEELRDCEHAEPADIERLSEVLEITSSGISAEDAALQHGLLAELNRLRDDHPGAVGELDAALAGLPAAPSGRLARWRWLQAHSRLRVPIDAEQVAQLLAAIPKYPFLLAASLFTLTSSPSFEGPTRETLERAAALSAGVDRPTRWAAEISRALGECTEDQSLLAVAADLDRKLGLPRRARVPSPADGDVQILADRRGELAAGLPSVGWQLAEPRSLQRRLVVEWPELAHEMGAALFKGSALRRALKGRELAALRLASDDVTVQALPWELALPPPRVLNSMGTRWPAAAYRSLPQAAARIDARWLQRALGSSGLAVPVDGVLGPVTLHMLEQLMPAARLPVAPSVRATLERSLFSLVMAPPLAVLLRPEADVESVVSSQWQSGFDAADLYTSSGFRVQIVSSLRQIPLPTEPNDIAVLHVAARMDMRGAGPYFDFSSDELGERLGSKSRGTDVGVTDFVRWLRGCGPGTEPLVVLDPPYPGSPYDVPWQIVLRNLFAAMLFAEAVAPAIIATGVRTKGPDYIAPIAGGIVGRQPLAVIADRLRSGYGDRPYAELADANWGFAEDELARRATAIFAAPSAFTLPGE
jgi:cellulose synthase operon protein C